MIFFYRKRPKKSYTGVVNICHIWLGLTLLLIFISTEIHGQQVKGATVNLDHQISGILTDSVGLPITGASVSLRSSRDSVTCQSNADGIFIFKKIKSTIFILSISSVGYNKIVRKYLFNDSQIKITLDPIVLGQETKMLQEVKINGTPTIKYKIDTVEYRARDYKIRENANINELLKKMEGFEVSSDNSVTYLGQQVTKAQLNGKEYAGGDVAVAIQNLPADIVEKIQVIDDYGFQAARTGIKNGTMKKVLNITTQSDKSVGNILRPTAAAGSKGRYDEQLFAQRINGNEQVGLIGNLKNSVNGVANNNSIVSIETTAAGSNGLNPTAKPNGGTTQTGVAAFNYRDDINEYLQVNADYNFNISNVHAVSSSSGAYFQNTNSSASKPLSTLFTQLGDGHNDQKQHLLDLDMEWAPNKTDFVKFSPNLKYTRNTIDNTYNYNQAGFVNQTSSGTSDSKETSPSLNAVLFYQHVFNKPKRNISLQFEVNGNNLRRNNNTDNNIISKDSLLQIIADSTLRRNINRATHRWNYNTTLTYTEPLSKSSLIDFSAQLNAKLFKDQTTTSNIFSGNHLDEIDSLSNSFKYNFNDYRFGINYHLETTNLKVSFGGLLNPSTLRTSSQYAGNTSNRNFFYILPIFRFQYLWSFEHSLLISYVGSQTEPAGYQIQPVADYSDPQNPVIGNPLLKPYIKHNIYVNYNNYIPNSKLNFSVNVTGSFYHNQIVPDIIQRFSTDLQSYINETRFANLDGARSVLGNYSISKQLDNRKYTLVLNGFIFMDHSITLNNGTQNVINSFRFNERLGPIIEPNDMIEVKPYVSYEQNTSNNSLPGATDIKIETLSLSIDGQLHLLTDRTFTIGYNVSKNFIHGIASSLQHNPFVINAFLEQQLFKKRNGIVKIAVFDALNQNRYVAKVINPNGYTDINSNVLSRYIMLSFSMNLQKWNGAPKKNGKTMRRRGDGSFY